MDKHFTASAVVLHPSRKILLLNHKKLGVWLGPGGHVENETPDACVLREVTEESGLDVKIIGEKKEELADFENDVQVLHQPYLVISARIADDHYHIDLIYTCVPLDSFELNPNEGESIEIGWFSRSDLDQLKLFQNYRKLLEQVFGNAVLWSQAFPLPCQVSN